MRSNPLLMLVVGALIAAPAHAADGGDLGPLQTRFADRVRPLLAANCVACHNKEKAQADVDLTAFADAKAVAADLPRWELVLEQLEAGTMPPAKAKVKPTPEERAAMIAWVKDVRRFEADRNAGDPGVVPARRLSNAEYDNAVRDLTGVDIRPTKEFPVDPANREGFDNSAESLTMSPALVKKYLEAARTVSNHLVLGPEGLDFADHLVLADTDRDKYCVRRVIDYYKRQPTELSAYFLAAWRYEHRGALGIPDATLDRIAADAKISPGYLKTVHALLTEKADAVGPIAALQAMWKDLLGDSEPVAAKGCAAMRDFVIELRGKLVPEVRNLTVNGMGNGSQPLVLWKNRKWVENRRLYLGNADKIKPGDLKGGTEEARRLALPADAKEIARYEDGFRRFCSVFPDAFVVTERERVFLAPMKNGQNAGRLLNAGFHSMTGYFRDDKPLYDLILDDAGRKRLDDLWVEFDVVNGAPARQYSSFLWFERAETPYFRETVFDFARAEDRNAASHEMIQKLEEVYLAKARRNRASDAAIEAIERFFADIDKSLRLVESKRAEAEPKHVAALVALAEKAFRRPLTKSEREAIPAFYRALRKEDGLTHEEAIRDTLASILMSPNFCYRVAATSGGGGVKPLSDHDLAGRLSFFLWSSSPDRELLDLAAKGELHRSDVLANQARRMLKDPKARGLATEFFANFLDFRRFEEHNSVDRTRFPTFDDELRRSMFEEPIRFFLDVVRNDRPVRSLVEGRHTFVNPALAKHYGIPMQGGSDDWMRVDDASKFGRGGLLPMAVFLTKNSPGLRTSPVKRGYWVVKRLLGEHIPAPPNNVPELPSDEAKLGELTLRETLERHRADKACAGCHERFDPFGLAFEAYGPIGERRSKDLAGHPVDTRANYPGGGEGDGLEGIRAYVQEKRLRDFDGNFRRKLLAYALGRTLLASDDATLDAMKSRSESDGGRFGALVEAIVVSPQFRNKRVEADLAEE